MPEQLLTILKFLLLALLYLFFLRVLRAVWTEVREPAVAKNGAGSGPSTAPAKPETGPKRRSTRAATPTRLAVVAPASIAGTEHRLATEMTIGRAPGCTIVADDGYVSAVHTRVYGRDGAWLVEDLGSTNGTYLNRRKVTAPSSLKVGDRIQLGNVELEVR